MPGQKKPTAEEVAKGPTTRMLKKTPRSTEPPNSQRPKDDLKAIETAKILQDILEFNALGYSNRQIADVLRIPRHQVSRRLKEAADAHWEQIPKEVSHMMSRNLTIMDKLLRLAAQDIQAIKEDNDNRQPDEFGNVAPARLHTAVTASILAIQDRYMRLLGLDHGDRTVINTMIVQNNKDGNNEAPIIQLYIPDNFRDTSREIEEPTGDPLGDSADDPPPPNTTRKKRKEQP